MVAGDDPPRIQDMHRGLQVWHQDTHRAQVIAKAQLMGLCDSMLSVCPQSEVTLWYPSLGSHASSPQQEIHVFPLAFGQGCFLRGTSFVL